MDKLLITTLILLASMAFLNKKSLNVEPKVVPYTSESPLVAYGRAIFEREACGNCHTLHFDKANAKRISLDGLGGKYPDIWFYYYLKDPKIVLADAKKSAYPQLYERNLDKTLATKLMPEANKAKMWEQLQAEANLLQENLEAEGIIAEGKEIIALIAYLQQIPMSEKAAKLDSLERYRQAEEQEDWNHIILPIANNPRRHKEAGRQLFQVNCSPCHGSEGQGIVGPNLTDEYWLHGGSSTEITKTIMFGVPEKGMLAWKNILKPEQIGQLIAFIHSIQGSKPENAKAPQGEKQ